MNGNMAEYIRRLMRNRERQQWTEYVRRREERKDKKPGRPRTRKKPEPSQAERGIALDDLTGAAPALKRLREGGRGASSSVGRHSFPVVPQALERVRDVQLQILGGTGDLVSRRFRLRAGN